MGLNPFEWSYVSFNLFYMFLMVIGVAAGFYIPRKIRPEGTFGRLLHPGEYPLLMGWRDRFADVHLVHLLESGGLAMEGGKLVRRGQPANPSALDHAILQLPSPLRMRAVRKLTNREASAVLQDMVRRGLLMTRAETLRIGLIAAMPLLITLAFGWFRLQASGNTAFLGSFLWALVGINAIIVLVPMFGGLRYTRAGKRYWSSRGPGSAKMKRAVTGSDLVHDVALYGSGTLTGSPLADYHEWRKTLAGGSAATEGSRHMTSLDWGSNPGSAGE